MKKIFLSLFLISLSYTALAKRPNIILVFIDDMGWGDFSCFGNEAAKTPHIDRLAKEGLRFDQFYVNSPICSPSRVAISTGQYPQRWKITSYLSNRDHNTKRGMAQWLDPKAPMLARSLKNAGYATGHFGKWHMGGQRNVADAPPISAYGFDESLTNFEGMGPKLLPLTLKPGQDPNKPGRIWGDATRLGGGVRWMQRSKITEGFVDAAIPFIKKQKRTRNHSTSISGRMMFTLHSGHPLTNGGTDRNASSFSPCSRKWTVNWASYSIIFITIQPFLKTPSFSPVLITVLKREPGWPVPSVDTRHICSKEVSVHPLLPGHPS